MIANIKDIKYVVISIIGPHAGEDEDKIFKRKMIDIHKVGKTFWLIRSYSAKPNMVQDLSEIAQSDNKDVYVIFISPSREGGAIHAKTAFPAKQYSSDGAKWFDLPPELTPVTGKLPATALVFNELEIFHNRSIDLWDYTDSQKQPIEIRQGRSTLCAIKKDIISHTGKMKSHKRQVIAIGKLCSPYCVWVK